AIGVFSLPFGFPGPASPLRLRPPGSPQIYVGKRRQALRTRAMSHRPSKPSAAFLDDRFHDALAKRRDCFRRVVPDGRGHDRPVGHVKILVSEGLSEVVADPVSRSRPDWAAAEWMRRDCRVRQLQDNSTAGFFGQCAMHLLDAIQYFSGAASIPR